VEKTFAIDFSHNIPRNLGNKKCNILFPCWKTTYCDLTLKLRSTIYQAGVELYIT